MAILTEEARKIRSIKISWSSKRIGKKIMPSGSKNHSSFLNRNLAFVGRREVADVIVATRCDMGSDGGDSSFPCEMMTENENENPDKCEVNHAMTQQHQPIAANRRFKHTRGSSR